MRIWLARHGVTDENTAGGILGRRDPPLSDAGVAQAEVLAARPARGIRGSTGWPQKGTS